MRPLQPWRVFAFSILVCVAYAPTQALGFDWAGRLRVTTERLKDSKAAVRLQAVRELGEASISQSAPYLLRATADEDDGVRLAAAGFLVQHRVAAVVPVLVEWLSDFELKIRVEAVRLLGQLGSTAAVGPLIRTFGDLEHQVRMAAVEALGRIGSRKAITGIIGRLDDTNVKVRQAAIGVLSELTDARSVIPLLGKLNDPATEIRQAAVKALARIADPRAIPSLLRLLRDSAVGVRIEAISALGQLRTTTATAALVNAFGESRNLEERRALVKAFGRLRTKESRAALLGALPDQGLSESVLEALVTAGSEMVPALTRALGSGRLRPPEALLVVKALRDIGDRRASPALVREFHRDLVPRAHVVEALATCGDTAAAIPLIRILESESVEEKLLVLRALEPIVDRRAIRPLLPVLAEKAPELRLMGVRILGRLRAREATPRLLQLLNKEEGEGRREVVVALGRIGDPKVGRILLPLLGSTDDELRRTTLNTLAKLQPMDLLPELIATAASQGEDSGRKALAVDAVAAILRGRPLGNPGQTLLGLATSGRQTLATAALTAIAASGDASLATKLGSYLPTAPPWLTGKILETLGYLPTETSTAAILSALGSKEWKHRAVAAWALGRAGHLERPAVKAALAKALNDPHLAVRTNAAGALSAAPPKAALPGLRRLLSMEDADPYLLANVVMALAALGDHVSADAIRRLLAYERTNQYLDANVLRALCRLGRPVSELRLLVGGRNDDGLEKLLGRLENPPPPARPTWIGLDLLDRHGGRKRGEPFLLIFSDGRVRWSFTDERGQAFEERIPPGTVNHEQVRAKPGR